MSTLYVWIKASSEPSDLGVDAAFRSVYGFIVVAERVPQTISSGNFEDELATILTSVATAYIGSRAILPDGDGPYLVIIAGGGLAPQSTQNTKVEYRNPAASIHVHAKDSAAANAMAMAAYAALVVVQNQAI